MYIYFKKLYFFYDWCSEQYFLGSSFHKLKFVCVLATGDIDFMDLQKDLQSVVNEKLRLSLVAELLISINMHFISAQVRI